MSSEKIYTIEELKKKVNEIRLGKKIVLCHGTFDLMHTGHIKYLQRAKYEGDILIVTVTADKYVNKGPGRPVFSEKLRAENLSALECVNYVAISYSNTAEDLLRKICPDVYVKGSDYKDHSNDVTGNIAKEIAVIKSYGGRVFYTNEITFSSSKLLNEYFDVFSPETKNYLKDFSSKYSDIDAIQAIDSLSRLKVLVIGDSIIDEYHYVTTLGQTGKGNIFSVQYQSEEKFAGGSLAVANHVSQFTNSVDLFTGIDSSEDSEKFIRKNLNKNINPIFAYFEDAPTVTKRRYVDSDLNKLFEVYLYKEKQNFKGGEDQFLFWMRKNLKKYDLVISADFGNGFISQKMVELLCSESNFLAVNTQINSGNRGYHVINRYTKANFISLNEPELRLAAHNRHDPLENVCKKIFTDLNAYYIGVTRGNKGIVYYSKEDDSYHEMPAFSTRVVDRVGAGDTFLSIASMCVAGKVNSNLASFIGNVAAAMNVQIVCNRESIDPINLKKYITTLLK
ncbi:PfkB family carbohydrate kinase [Polynucleobacter sp. HIN8]|uniref:PfkB family carbohydrate kinase n=1 Tax=Polynucleobacter sp. HIN8 TaxID=3047867 RepID=UPI0025743FAF|nr:PfkB family carbohydrate kinase [Polynucleobacter sp. HIN8]BEI38358.1 PfkB family carbohydrate kinase [Polynucleobacter sp. HIN8]